MSKPNTMTVWEGNSEYTGNPISVFITMKSSNIKTGDIPQVTLVPDNVKPTDSLKNGRDKDVCGNCPLRPIHYKKHDHKKPCYVNLRCVNSIDRASNKPQYLFNNLFDVIRLGNWGDSASAKKEVILEIVGQAKKVLNYTHAYANQKFSYLKAFTMASVHSVEEKIKANKLGFRTFRTIPLACIKLEKDEIVCPNFVNKAIQCKQCKLCCGNQIKSNINIVIPAH